MIYGITGNTQKDKLWRPVADLVAWLDEQQLPFCLKEDLARGLADRGMLAADLIERHTHDDPAGEADVLLSFGGDGTLLRSAHEAGERNTPILGINIGRLGFLADIEVGRVKETIACMERGDFRTEERMVLDARVAQHGQTQSYWALNDFVIERSGSAGLISIDVSVDGTPLNNYWGDGLIVSTPTGSTAYSLSLGGPIVVPGCAVIIVTPLAPHSLTVRPIVLPQDVVIEARVGTHEQPYVLAADGESILYEGDHTTFTIYRAAHTVRLVKLPHQHYFQTIRSKLMWGVRKIG